MMDCNIDVNGFFDLFGNSTIKIGNNGANITVDFLYGLFKAALISELEAEGRLLPRDMTVEEYARWKATMVKK